MDMITVTAKTVDEAVTKALIELETTSDKLEYEVVDKGSAGFLGIGAKPAIIRAKKKETEGSEAYFKEWVNNDNCVIRVVRGNNDFFSQTDREKEISIGKYRAFLTHGHMYGVSFELETIKEEARARKADIVMFGHTHKPHLEYCEDGLVVLNPGSLSYPRQDGRKPSYMLMEIDRNGEAHYTVCYVDQDRDIPSGLY